MSRGPTACLVLRDRRLRSAPDTSCVGSLPMGLALGPTRALLIPLGRVAIVMLLSVGAPRRWVSTERQVSTSLGACIIYNIVIHITASMTASIM